jgi:predicted XRE-type DNA-binding protein
MNDVSYEKSSGNVFADLGFSPAATADPSVKSRLIMTISNTMREREPTQEEAARLCRTDQPTLSKVLRGRMESITIDKLAAWLNALGRTVEIHVRPYDRKAKAGQLVMAP